MTYYIYIENKKINGAGTVRCLNDEILNIEVSEEIYQSFLDDRDKYIYSEGIIKKNPEYAELCKKRLQQQKKEELLQQLNELDAKRIRAVCEHEVKDIETGETWLDYYTSEISKLRLELNTLE